MLADHDIRLLRKRAATVDRTLDLISIRSRDDRRIAMPERVTLLSGCNEREQCRPNNRDPVTSWETATACQPGIRNLSSDRD